MPGTQEILAALRGAVGIGIGDPRAMENFEQSTEAFFRSFFALVLALPFYAVISTAEWRIVTSQMPGEIPVGLTTFMAVKIAGAGAAWLLFPLLLAGLAGPLGLSRRYAPYIIVYNWASLVILAAVTGPYMLYSLGALPVGGAAFMHLLLLIAALWYRWKIAVSVLGVSAAMAAGLVALDLVIEIGVDYALSLFF